MKINPICNILVVDDDPVTRRFLRGILEKQGYSVITAQDGEEAWKSIQSFNEKHIGIAVIDWIMPKIDGLELCRKIKADFNLRYIYIIMITASTQKAAERLYALEVGADDFLTKPIDRIELLARIRVGKRIAEYEQTLQQLALIDPLTELRNRRAFDDDLEQIYNFSVRRKHSFALMLADVDNFKNINDGFGHDVGDVVLQIVSRVLRETFRKEDRIFRVGGDEFAVLLSDIHTPDQIPRERIYQNLIKLAKASPIEGFKPKDLSISIGTACHTSSEPLSIHDLYRLADERMYDEKREKYKISKRG